MTEKTRLARVRTLQASLFVLVGTAGLLYRQVQGERLGAFSTWFLSLPFLLALVFLGGRAGLPFRHALAWGAIGHLAAGLATLLGGAAMAFFLELPYEGLFASPGGWLLLLFAWPAYLVTLLGCVLGVPGC